MDKITHTPTRAEQTRTSRYIGYAIGVCIESAAICFIMAVALVISYLVVNWYR